MNRKFLILSIASFAMLMTSCGTVSRYTTASSVDVSNTVTTTTIADLEVGERVKYVYNTTESERLAGREVCRNAAIASLLKQSGNADVLVAPEFSYDGEMKTIEVSGRPAKYRNFRNAK